jgi:hypothetical protein
MGRPFFLVLIYHDRGRSDSLCILETQEQDKGLNRAVFSFPFLWLSFYFLFFAVATIGDDDFL